MFFGFIGIKSLALHGHANAEARSRLRLLRATELGRLPDGFISHRGLSGLCVPAGIGVGHQVEAGEDDASAIQRGFAACLGVLVWGCSAKRRF